MLCCCSEVVEQLPCIFSLCPCNQGNLSIKPGWVFPLPSAGLFHILPTAMGIGSGTGATVVGVMWFLGYLLAVSSGPVHAQRRTPPVSQWIVAGSTQPHDLVILTGLSSWWVVPAAWSFSVPRSEVLSVLGPRNMPEVVFQKTFSSAPHRAWPRSRNPRVCIVILPLRLTRNSTWHLPPPLIPFHHRSTRWPKWQRCSWP